MTPQNFRDGISNGSGVIMLTDRQSHKQTLLKTIPPSLRYAARVTYLLFIGDEQFLELFVRSFLFLGGDLFL